MLEAPFNHMAGVLAATQSWPVRLAYALAGLATIDMEFRSTKWLAGVQCPVLILHAGDDTKVPAALSKELLQAVEGRRVEVSRVVLEGFNFGHLHICHYPGLATLLATFWEGGMVGGENRVVKAH